jgi:hypothetical protein
MSRGLRKAVAVCFGLLLLVTLAACSGGSDKAPWKDPSAKGTITLYDKSGKVMTGGSISTHPVVWKAVASTPAGRGLDGTGKFAALLAYQPRKGADPSEWSGDFLSASTPYSDAARPTVTMTSTDFSLDDFLKEFPPMWNGMIQLRVFLGAPGTPLQTSPYDAVAVKVSGGKWTLVEG